MPIGIPSHGYIFLICTSPSAVVSDLSSLELCPFSLPTGHWGEHKPPLKVRAIHDSVGAMSAPIPQPRGVPLLGNIFDVDPNNTWWSLKTLAEKYG